jgi:hypothetical protein
VLFPDKLSLQAKQNDSLPTRSAPGNATGRVLSSEFWPELQFLAQFLPDFGGIMLTSF